MLSSISLNFLTVEFLNIGDFVYERVNNRSLSINLKKHVITLKMTLIGFQLPDVWV